MYQPLIKFHPHPAIITQVLSIFVEDMMRFGIDNSGKTLFSRFVSVLTFLYLCIRYDVVRQCQIWKNKVSPISLSTYLSVSLPLIWRDTLCWSMSAFAMFAGL